MAPLRSSRSNRHLQQENGPQGRLRGGVVDHDPMEGLPVRRWEMMDITIKQNAKDADNDEESKGGTNPNWPWPDLPLPKDFHLLPPHSQELLRRARAPNKNPNIAVFNRETGEYERPNLDPNNPAAMTPCSKVPNFKDNFQLSSAPSGDTTNRIIKDSDNDGDLEPDKTHPEESHERIITLKRWTPLPQSIADKKLEPKYLADRRPGLPPLYGHQAANNATGGYAPNISSTLLPNSNPNTNTGDVVVGHVTVPADRAANASGYRVAADGKTVPLGPGIPGGSAMGIGMPGTGQGQGQGEIKRRPPPPPPKRRKRGGPGRSRKKVEVNEAVVKGNAGAGVSASTASDAAKKSLGATAAANEGPAEPQAHAQALPGEGGDVKLGAGVDVEMGEAGAEAENDEGEEESSTSGGEEEGSEEGEIDEGAGDGGAGSAVAPPLMQHPLPPPPPRPTTSTTTTNTAAPTAQSTINASEVQQPAPATIDTTVSATTATADPSAPTAPTATPTTPPASTSASPKAANDSTPPPNNPISVSIQPPSPDLLGNLESEIQGMERGALNE